jgi:hypothetical protein
MTPVVLHKSRCPRCSCLLKAELPAEYRYRYCPRLTALIGARSDPRRDSRSAVQEFCRSVFGIPISCGAIQSIEERTEPSQGE